MFMRKKNKIYSIVKLQNSIFTCLVFTLLFFITNDVFAQSQPPTGVGGNSNNNNTPTLSRQDSLDAQGVIPNEIDTFKIKYTFANNPKIWEWYADTTLGNHFQQYDPARRGDFDFLTLGNPTTAAHPSVWQSRAREGFDFGQHAFDIYQIRPAQLRFYELGKAYSDVFYSGNSESDGALRAKFGRTLNLKQGKLQLSLDYERIFNVGATSSLTLGDFGLLNYSRGRTVGFAAGVWFRNKSERYQNFTTFAINTLSQLDFGGLTTDTIFSTQTDNTAFTTPTVWLSNAQTRHESRELSFVQYLQLNKKDTTRQIQRTFLLSHRFSYENTIYKMYDNKTNTLQDTIWYGKLLTDSRGLRFGAGFDAVNNLLSISTSRPRRDSLQHGKINDLFEVGLQHQIVFLRQEGTANNTQNNLLLRGGWLWTPNDWLNLDVKAMFIFAGTNIGDYRLSGKLSSKLGKVMEIFAQAQSQLYEPTQIQREAYISQKVVWQNNFKKTLENNISAGLFIPTTRTKVEARLNVLNNQIYMDSTARPTQVTAPLSILQFLITQNFKFKNFHFDNNIALQTSSSEAVRVSPFVLKNSLYYEGRLFKKAMFLRAGIDGRWVSRFYADGFMPLTGQFYWQNGREVGNFPALDVFVSAKVQTFRFFFKMENLTRAVGLSQAIFYQIPLHPIREQYFRFGFAWKLSD
jgi:hypothetical protein